MTYDGYRNRNARSGKQFPHGGKPTGNTINENVIDFELDVARVHQRYWRLQSFDRVHNVKNVRYFMNRLVEHVKVWAVENCAN